MNINVFSDQIKDAAVLCKKKNFTPNFNEQYRSIVYVYGTNLVIFSFFAKKCKKLKNKFWVSGLKGPKSNFEE